jgi:hypothetical protein
MIFDPTRISAQVLEMAYELTLPTMRHRFHRVEAWSEIGRSEASQRMGTYHKEEVA